MKTPKILYFINGSMPTPEQKEEALKYGTGVSFRNATALPEYDPKHPNLEPCDGVAGEVPDEYAEAYPTAEKALDDNLKKLRSQQSKMGDVPAPKKEREPIGGLKKESTKDSPKSWDQNK